MYISTNGLDLANNNNIVNYILSALGSRSSEKYCKNFINPNFRPNCPMINNNDLEEI